MMIDDENLIVTYLTKQKFVNNLNLSQNLSLIKKCLTTRCMNDTAARVNNVTFNNDWSIELYRWCTFGMSSRAFRVSLLNKICPPSRYSFSFHIYPRSAFCSTGRERVNQWYVIRPRLGIVVTTEAESKTARNWQRAIDRGIGKTIT